MADAKISELVSATSAGGSDLLYLIQSNTSKKITVGSLFANAGNVTLTGNINLGGTPQLLSSPGTISLTTPVTHLVVDSIGGVLQLPRGTNGQLKILTLISTSGGSYTLNTDNVAGSLNVILDKNGDTVVLVYTNNKWFPVTSSSIFSVGGASGVVSNAQDRKSVV